MNVCTKSTQRQRREVRPGRLLEFVLVSNVTNATFLNLVRFGGVLQKHRQSSDGSAVYHSSLNSLSGYDIK